jgi:hypothetical protein
MLEACLGEFLVYVLWYILDVLYMLFEADLLRHIVGAYLGYIGIYFDALFGTWLRCMLDIWLVVYQ